MGQDGTLVHNSAGYSQNSQDVYALVNRQGVVRYIGRGDEAAREIAHSSTAGRSSFQYVKISEGLSKDQAKGLEQALIARFGGSKSMGGTQLQNKIRSYLPTHANAAIRNAYGANNLQSALDTLKFHGAKM